MSKKIIATNPVAKHNYAITDTLEAGIVLTGTEIKSIRNRKSKFKRLLCDYQRRRSLCSWYAH